ncbi:MAG TPA: tRNA dihydrouridine synthase DusB [Piscirickettsiaceae bacterium]|nr:tRNA dihydrouridine synthase DusB [Piscirickettsiaceae bacterium]HIQ41069.1 tRNA dihydrouridine synthase DusB [Sulfurivirga caldicuralii]
MITPIRLGGFTIHPVMLAPMAGVTDRVFRQLCRRHGAGYTVAEMTHSKPQLRTQRKSCTRRADLSEPAPRVIQLLGYDPTMLAEAARWHVAQGAQIIDLNLGCPAKKVCNVAAGAALMRQPKTVAAIFQAVTAAVDVPVTVKMRTGTDENCRNAPQLARMAEDCGIQMVVIHGRTRRQKFQGDAEYDTIAAVKQSVSIPVIANGDIDSGEKARSVLEYTGADGVMVGRASYGNPWVFAQINAALTATPWQPPERGQVIDTMLEHISGLHALYGETVGVRMARKHVIWYAQRHFPHGCDAIRNAFNRLDTPRAQLKLIENLIHEAA